MCLQVVPELCSLRQVQRKPLWNAPILFISQVYVKNVFGSIQSVYMHRNHNLSIQEVALTQLQDKLKKNNNTPSSIIKW